ncbi:MAG: decaprenyl-phosphate phosphoribosyltransferase [Acidobacteria bacterium]|nr:decaprenyl-phosphate phosphoribosyltransferase [Acidobacteriota bacterium]
MPEPAEQNRPKGILLDLLESMRPQQWIKNLLLLAPLLFAKGLGDSTRVLEALLAFLIFCALSSGVYLLNDVLDFEKDRKHPVKSRRPIASGRLKVGTAVVILVFLLLGSLTAGFALTPYFGAAGLAYVLLNLGYSFWLKEMVILDVMIIAFGFVLRALAGALAIQVEISPWLILCTIMLSLFLAFCKRRRELELLADGARDHRPALREYSVLFLDQMISITTASTVVCYSFYTISPEVEQKLGTHHLFVTIPFVLYGIFRYLYLVHQRGQGGNPASSLLTDRPLLACVALWALVVAGILYFDTFR